jgi:hypothetical protein
VGVRGLQQVTPHVEGNLWHCGCEGHKTEKISHWKEMQKTLEWQIHSTSCTPTTGSASRYKIVCWYRLSNIYGSQLLDHISGNFVSVQFTNINSCTVTAIHPSPNTYPEISPALHSTD